MSRPRDKAIIVGTTLLLAVSALSDVDAFVFDGDVCAAEIAHVPSSPNLMVFADSSNSMQEPITPGQQTTNTNPTFQGSMDIGLQVEPANIADNPQNRPGLSLSKDTVLPPYAWVANHTNGTVSKFNMETHQEEGRYMVGNNPSRTAVDLDGNAWVATRGSGHVTKILWNTDECPDTNNNGVINTSNGTNVVPFDECVVYHAQPRPGWTIRGIAAGPDGRVWIGYSSNNGAIQSIDVATFQLGPIIPASNIPLFQANSNGVFTRVGNSTIGGCNNYGLVLDSQGLLYYSNTCRDRLPVYDTRNEQWLAAYYTPGIRSFYGVAVDAERRVWLGGWPDRTGVRMFDPYLKRMYYFPTNGNHLVTGVAAEPGTGDIWASFYNTGYTGRLRFNESNYASYNWTMIPTTKNSNGSNLSGVGNDLRGVGFDIHGNAWTLGLGSNRIFKLDPATNQRHASLPVGKAVGQGSHYTYSDFTGSTALSFTAPNGKWSHTYNTQGAQIHSITIEAHVPTGTAVGLRYRAVDQNGNATTPWSPATVGGSEMYHPYVSGQNSLTVHIPQSNDNPFVAERLQLEVRLSTSDKGIRPFLYAVSLDMVPHNPVWDNTQNIASDLSNSFSIGGTCTEDDGTGCDIIRVGLAYFNDSVDVVADVGENTSGAINDGVAQASTSGLTGISNVAHRIRNQASLQDTTRDNFALIITDGKFNTRNEVISAIGHLCEANRRGSAPVTTFVMGPGGSSDVQTNSLLTAAGGTGACCPGSNANCAVQDEVDVCAMSNSALAAALNQWGSSPYSQVTVNTDVLSCTGALDLTEVTLFKNTLRTISNELACTVPLHIPDDPDMYNRPEYPQVGALPNPAATRVRLDHTQWSLIDVPYCEESQTGCGFQSNLLANGVAANTAAAFADEGWYFATSDRSKIRLTSGLCNQIAQRRVRTTRTQVACQCLLDGEECTVPGAHGRCSIGRYGCSHGVDVCMPVLNPMPEVCNGMDDNCDGVPDNLAASGADWSNRGGVPSQYTGIQCDQRDACVCPPSVERAHRGTGETLDEEFANFLAENWNSGCYCGEGLGMSEGEPFYATPASSPDPTTHSSPQSGGCAVQPGSDNGGAGLVLSLIGVGLLWIRRRRF